MQSTAAAPATQVQSSSWRRTMQRFGTRRPSWTSTPARCEVGAADFGASATADGGASAEKPADARQEPPLQFEMFTREWSGMSQQDNWDGFRIEAGTQVTKCLQASHSLFLGTQLRETGYIYQFGPAFQSENQRTVMVARTGLDGSVNGRVIQKLGTGFEVKASSQSHLKDPMRNMHEGAFEYTGKDWTCSGKLAYQGAWLTGGSFTQRLMPELQLGGDLMLVLVKDIMKIGQLGARWSQGQDTCSAMVARQDTPQGPAHEMRLQYVRKVSERLSMGTELKLTYPDYESGLSLSYEYLFRSARIQGLLDTAGKVSCSVTDSQGIGLSGQIDYVRGDYKFGVLMHVIPPEQ